MALRNLDTNGHGTFMAGLIAGRDSTVTAPDSAAPASAYRGMAPDARIVSLKVATADGGADAAQVIAAIDWVVQHAHDPGFNIRVINLSCGTNSKQSYGVDPLAYAAEQAWKKGIVVVAAAGNTGYQRGNAAPGLANPAYDPYIIGVGGYDYMGTASYSDDVVGAYSASSAGCGAAYKNPDFVADGSHQQGLRVPCSYLDQTHAEGRIDSRYFRGSGHLRGGGDRLRVDRAGPAEVPEADPRPGEPIRHRQWEEGSGSRLAGAGWRRDRDRPHGHEDAPGLRAEVHGRDG